MKVTVRLAGSCRRVGGFDDHLEQWVGFAGVLFGNELSHGENNDPPKTHQKHLLINPI